MNTNNNTTVTCIKAGAKYSWNMLCAMWKNYFFYMLVGTLAHLAVIAFSYYIYRIYGNAWYGIADFLVGGTLVNIACMFVMKAIVSKDSERFLRIARESF